MMKIRKAKALNKFASVSGGTEEFLLKNIKQQTDILNEQISSRKKQQQTTQMQLNIPCGNKRYQDPIAD